MGITNNVFFAILNSIGELFRIDRSLLSAKQMMTSSWRAMLNWRVQ